mgnify:CR=1 FL=1
MRAPHSCAFRSTREGVLSECKVRLVANEVLLDVATGSRSTSSTSSRHRQNPGAASQHDKEKAEPLMLQRYVRAKQLDARHAWGPGACFDDAGRVLKVRKSLGSKGG